MAAFRFLWTLSTDLAKDVIKVIRKNYLASKIMMNEVDWKKHNAETILQKHGLRITISRLNTLAILIQARTAVPVSLINRRIKGINRITLYKTLKTLEKSGVIYKFFDTEGSAFYAISDREQVGPKNLYIHFICLICKRIFSCPAQKLLAKTLPYGFKAKRFILCVFGRCNMCR